MGIVLPAAANFATAPSGVAFDICPPGVRVHLGVEHEHVDVVPAGQHVVEAAGPDVVRPAVAADDPHAAPDQVIDDAAQVGDDRFVQLVEPPLAARPPVRAARAARTPAAAAPRGSRRPAPRRPGRAARSGAGGPARCGCRPRAAGRVRTRRCPRTASSTTPGRARRRRPSTASWAGSRRRSTSSRSRWRSSAGRRTAARRASGTASPRTRRTRRRTRTAAPGTACRAPCRSRPASGRCAGSRSKNAIFSRSAAQQRLDRFEVDRLARRVSWRGDRAGLDAQPAAGAVLDVDLQRVARVRQPGSVERGRPEPVRRAVQAGIARSGASGSRCAGRRSCSCRTGCTAPSPRPRPVRRCCASRTASCRSGRCRRPAAR